MSSLENLVRVGQLKAEPPANDEIVISMRKAALCLADTAFAEFARRVRVVAVS